jgi:glycosyltransferase involved in cell wall biosynthesis
MGGKKLRVLYVVNNAAFFVSHRLPIAVGARQRGDEIVVATGRAGSPTLEASALEELRRLRIDHRSVAFTSSGINPAVEVLGLSQLVRVMRTVSPTVVHCASPKGVLFGGIAARLTGVAGVVLAVSGQGYMYSTERKLGTGRVLYQYLLRRAYGHRNKKVIVQNNDDRMLIINSGLARPDEVALIPGSGVPLEPYGSLPIAPRENLVVLPARMLADKGVIEFVTAAKLLRSEGLNWTFALVGTADYKNPSAIGVAQLREWVRTGAVEWWGHRSDMPAVYGRARIVCLPSYREGMPKVLLEAAAAGCAVVTTDAVGCREAVEPGVTGDLVPVKDSAALARALRRLIDDHERMRRYAEAGRKMAIARFSVEAVVRQCLGIYDEVAGRS